MFSKPSYAILKYTDTEAINIKSDASTTQAIETDANFIDETIPIVDGNTLTLIGTINEGDLFKMYLGLQRHTIDLEKQ